MLTDQAARWLAEAAEMAHRVKGCTIWISLMEDRFVVEARYDRPNAGTVTRDVRFSAAVGAGGSNLLLAACLGAAQKAAAA
jgi:hypothetical protein